ncbi:MULTISPECIES: YkvA family protein [Bacteria]|uniref:YkvA family protein n=1 Tax=Bacteria TaxID=2 RepID=UPI0036256A79
MRTKKDPGILKRLKDWAKRLKRDLFALQIAVSEDLVPWYVKGIILFTVGYALSPIDLIPDFIPVIGLLDDLLILPGLIWLAIRLIPQDVMEYCRREAEIRPMKKRKNWIAGILILLIWIVILVWLYYRYF